MIHKKSESPLPPDLLQLRGWLPTSASLSNDVAISIDSGFATLALLFVLDFAVLGFWIG
ncbi:hypothetical protein [Rhizobium leguminosarum]|uniref:hypothetical protein n=1 Tax=Rhizobium leguminosarum TaxID=384 RepID=UPI001C97125A|nr:hypothetical protein [Rhizobium leguminosarum]MBY5391941.1 hypothetical protein [Rhizobium leguminosarum]